MKTVKCEIYKKSGRDWIAVNTITDVQQVHTSLLGALINKKLCQCSYIKSISRRTNYDGTQQITVIYDNGYKDIYTVEETI